MGGLDLSLDPTTLAQIEALSSDPRPLLVADVDEVVLEFVDPFVRFLDAAGYQFSTASFRLTGNIVSRDDGTPAEPARTGALLEGFFAEQGAWQTAVSGAVEVLGRLAADVEIVLLTAMPHRHRDERRALLDRLGIPYPLLTTEMAKGPAIARLRGDGGRAVAFIDDLPPNLFSVRDHVPDAALFHLMSNAAMRALLPPLPEGIHALADWTSAEPAIRAALLD